MKIKGVANAFSIQMVDAEGNFKVDFCQLDKASFDALKEGVPSFVGHQDTATCLGVEYNRGFLSLKRGEGVLVGQLIGGRLPEGSTALPEGFSFRYYWVTIQ